MLPVVHSPSKVHLARFHSIPSELAHKYEDSAISRAALETDLSLKGPPSSASPPLDSLGPPLTTHQIQVWPELLIVESHWDSLSSDQSPGALQTLQTPFASVKEQVILFIAYLCHLPWPR